MMGALAALRLARFDTSLALLNDAERFVGSHLLGRDLRFQQVMLRVIGARTRWESQGELLSLEEVDELTDALLGDFDGWTPVFAAFIPTAAATLAANGGFSAAMRLYRSALQIAQARGWKRLGRELDLEMFWLLLDAGDAGSAASVIAKVKPPALPDHWLDGLRTLAEAGYAIWSSDIDCAVDAVQRSVDCAQSTGQTLLLWRAQALCSALSVLKNGDLAGAQRRAIDCGLRRLESVEPTSSLSLSELTTRERATIELISEGLSAKEVARRLDISVHTVTSYRKLAYQKLGIKKRSGLSEILRPEGD